MSYNESKSKVNVDTLVSVIVPCYNCEKTLEKCVDSIRNQTYKNIEIILVDDGSKDSTSSICDQYHSQDERIIVIHQENGGLVRAWKAGVREALGDYIAFCDSDDYIDEDLVEKTIQVALKTKADIISFGAKVEYSDKSELLLKNQLRDGFYDAHDLNEVKSQLLFTGKMQSQMILNSRWSKLYKKSLLIDHLNDISDNLTNGEDAVTTYVTVMNAENLVNIADYYPYHYLRNDQSMVGRHDTKWFDKMALMREELLKNSSKFNRQDDYQIDNFFFSYILMYAKKEIARSDESRKTVVKNLSDVRNNEIVENTLRNVDVSQYSNSSNMFAELFLKKKVLLLYYFTKAAVFLGYGKQ